MESDGNETRGEATLAERQQRWDEASVGWERWWSTIEGATRALNERLLELAELRPGMRVLDIATGLGEPALSAARRVGPAGSVLGVDLAPGMLERATKRAAREGLTNVTLERRDVERLGLAGAAFEAGLCRFGLMLVPDPVAAARAIRAALAAGAPFATAVWCSPAEAPFFELPALAATDVVGAPPLAEPGLGAEPGPTRLGRDELLRGVLETAGFVDVRLERRIVSYRFDEPSAFAALVQDVSSRLREALAGADAGARQRFERRLSELSAPHVAADGALVLANQVLLAQARVP